MIKTISILYILTLSNFHFNFKTNFIQENKIYSINQRKLEIHIFYSTSCPMCKKYTSEIRKLINEFYSDSIEFVFIYPNSNIYEIKQFMKNYSLNSKFKIDYQLKLCKKFNVKVTPEIVITNENKIILYKGAIDDLYYEIGKFKKYTTKNYIKEFIYNWQKNNLNNKIIYNKAFGCFINL